MSDRGVFFATTSRIAYGARMTLAVEERALDCASKSPARCEPLEISPYPLEDSRDRGSVPIEIASIAFPDGYLHPVRINLDIICKLKTRQFWVARLNARVDDSDAESFSLYRFSAPYRAFSRSIQSGSRFSRGSILLRLRKGCPRSRPGRPRRRSAPPPSR